jgi:hypothetical protein
MSRATQDATACREALARLPELDLGGLRHQLARSLQGRCISAPQPRSAAQVGGEPAPTVESFNPKKGVYRPFDWSEPMLERMAQTGHHKDKAASWETKK